MEFASCPIPQISISPAPPEVHLPEQSSPFRSLFVPAQDDAFRPTHLTPPPTSSNFKRPRSPLNPVDKTGKGLTHDRFEALLNASKASGGKRDVDLRKEIALKTHKTKQVERRALFLSKLQAPPSPSATTTPKTPPESPAIFHYRLPSPGLVSPLAMFESLSGTQDGIPDGWVEQVDFRLKTQPEQQPPRGTQPTRGVPSLAQISARFTQQAARADTDALPSLAPATAPARARPSVGVGRLRMPLRTTAPAPAPRSAPQPAAQQQPQWQQQQYVQQQQQQCAQPPVSPCSPALPEIRITTLLVSRTRSASPIELTEKNLHAFNARGQARDQRASDMLCKIRRRTLSSEGLAALAGAAPAKAEAGVDYRWRRRSAPADLMPLRGRIGFEHPVLALPGGF